MSSDRTCEDVGCRCPEDKHEYDLCLGTCDVVDNPLKFHRYKSWTKTLHFDMSITLYWWECEKCGAVSDRTQSADVRDYFANAHSQLCPSRAGVGG